MTTDRWKPPPEWSGPDVAKPLSQNEDEEMAQHVAKMGAWPIEMARWMVASVRLRREVSES